MFSKRILFSRDALVDLALHFLSKTKVMVKDSERADVGAICKTAGTVKSQTAHMNKTKQKDELIARPSTCELGNRRYRNDEFQAARRPREFYGVNVDAVWLCQLTGCLGLFLFASGQLRHGNKQVQRRHEQTWYLGVGWYPLLISEKSCKFL